MGRLGAKTKAIVRAGQKVQRAMDPRDNREFVSVLETINAVGEVLCYEQGIHNRRSCHFRILGIRKSHCYTYEVSERALLLGGRVDSNTQYRYVTARSYHFAPIYCLARIDSC